MAPLARAAGPLPRAALLLLALFLVLTHSTVALAVGFEWAPSVGFGVLTVGVTPGRFAISPTLAFAVKGERSFFTMRNSTAFVGADRQKVFGLNNELSVGGGYAWENVSLGGAVSLSGYYLPVCGPKLCSQLTGLAPGGSLRADFFASSTSVFGATADCSATWIKGTADAVWSGVSVRCSLGPILRFPSSNR